MNDSPGAKQQLLERIKSANNILVTVSANPNVDALSAALGLTIMLNKLDKHATAVVSGDMPPAISFLDPEKTFENTVDSLRDFIIALDKEKADHLRYKVDGDVVKIFITPYRTTITQDDLDFSQGDYNVELVLALGVSSKEHLDAALSAHGRILHDATVATLTCGEETSNLGSIDWHEANASSLSEMLVALSESLKSEGPLLDEQSSTALLTGIVAATDRFSNKRTSSKVMTMAAQLMAAGANQQLIAAKLAEAHEIGGANQDGSTDLAEDTPTKVQKTKEKKKKDDGELAIEHEEPEPPKESSDTKKDDKPASPDDELAEQLQSVAAAGTSPSVEDIKADLETANEELEEDLEKTPQPPDAILPPVAKPDELSGSPKLGGVLNATTEQAEHDKLVEQNVDQNHTILTHSDGDYVGDQQPIFQAPFNAINKKEEPTSVDIFKDEKPSINLGQADLAVPGSQAVAPPDLSAPLPPPPVESAPVASSPVEPVVDQSQAHQEAIAAVAAAYGAAPFNPANNPVESVGAQPLGEVSHPEVPSASPSAGMPGFEALPLPPTNLPPPPPPPVAPPMPPAAPDLSSPLPPPPAPAANPLQGPLPPEQLGQIFGATQPAPVPPPTPNDPNQFKIPGQ